MVQVQANKTVGEYTLVKPLGKGGNGQVWLAKSNASGDEVAIKILLKTGSIPVQRFRDEINKMKEFFDTGGIVPILAEYLPDSPSDDTPAWYVMPVAETVYGRTKGDLWNGAKFVLAVADVLIVLHSQHVFHRDIKPSNLLYYHNRCCIADFGLVTYPNKVDLTGNKLGPQSTMAPEMQRHASQADGGPADVYSLAKTLWILVTGEALGFEGEYVPSSKSISLRSWFPTAPLLYQLEDLLARATNTDPAQRPKIDEFGQALKKWLDDNTQFGPVSSSDWSHVQSSFFPISKPSRSFWENRDEIVTVLKVLAATARHNHLFAPDGGGMDLEGANPAIESGCIELDFGNLVSPVILRPKRLILETIHGKPEWSYFWLETLDLRPISKSLHGMLHEELIESETGQYSEIGSGLRSGARRITRYFEGSFMIVSKTSPHNRNNDYLGTFNQLSAEEFRQRIESIVQKI